MISLPFVERRNEPKVQDALFAAIAHGDDDHHRWLFEAVKAHFTSLPVPAPYGEESKEKLKADNDRLLRVARAAEFCMNLGVVRFTGSDEMGSALEAVKDLLEKP